jgi:uncharacterized membrane protein YfhO
MPGWSATVDGHAVADAAGGLFQSVRVPRGHHIVRFSYRPPGIIWGELAFMLGIAALVLGHGHLGRVSATRRRFRGSHV